jgi:D-tagatose-1,6-bisphosphate aldolase subunit GatZ/KbaZ
VLRAAARLAQARGAPLLVESTCNQVNQEGGYTGLTPERFAAQIRQAAARHALDPGQLLLGGDHLGPYPWKAQPAGPALAAAGQMVADYVRAGYTKLHLDASMGCADDPPGPLPKDVIAERAAQLCRAAEEAAGQASAGRARLYYVIGTEVPAPGGTEEAQAALRVTTPEDAAETIAVTCRAFLHFGLEDAWERVIALVVQPGVEYGNSDLHPYERDKAAGLSHLIEAYEGLVYEAHSTDYQAPQALRQLVEDHFAILKVGPALTFAFRQAVFALAWIEQEWLAGSPGAELSRLPEALEEAMLADPRHWRGYYQGDERQLRLARKYSLSDRARYYWGDAQVQASLARLFRNLEGQPVPATLLGQFRPGRFAAGPGGGFQPLAWVDEFVQRVLEDYYAACGWAPGLLSL